MNMRLKTAIERAKAASVPTENITRGIKRGTGEIEGAAYEELMYEAYGPNGIAVLIEIMTDNRNRTTPEIRALLARNGGQMGEAGSVAWMFERRGVIEVKGEGLNEDALMSCGLEAGMTDMEPSGEGFTLYSDSSGLQTLKEALEKEKYVVESAETPMVPKTPVEITDVEAARRIIQLIDVLEEHDDTQNIYSNFDMPDEVAAQIE